MKLPFVELDGIDLAYRHNGSEVWALERVSLTVHRRESLAIIGPSGCGKTSLLFLMAGLRRPTRGVVRIDGREVTGPRPQTALILQDYGLFPWKNVYQNAALGLEIRRLTKGEQARRVLPILEELGLGDFLYHYPSQLSGGQRQRLAIARALALEPDLLLMDEPFSALDALTRESLQELILGIWRKQRLTMILVTHSIEEAVYLGERIVVLSPRPGRVLAAVENPEVGSPDYRKTPLFHRRCVEVRRVLEAGKGEA